MELIRVDIEENRDRIIELLRSTKREGIKEVIRYMDENHFFTCPFSVRGHHNFLGGLAMHCLQECEYALSHNTGKLPEDSVIICALLHDLFKSGLFKITDHRKEMRIEQVSSESGTQCSSSIEILQERITLSDDEKNAINWHMSYNANDLDNIASLHSSLAKLVRNSHGQNAGRKYIARHHISSSSPLKPGQTVTDDCLNELFFSYSCDETPFNDVDVHSLTVIGEFHHISVAQLIHELGTLPEEIEKNVSQNRWPGLVHSIGLHKGSPGSGPLFNIQIDDIPYPGVAIYRTPWDNSLRIMVERYYDEVVSTLLGIKEEGGIFNEIIECPREELLNKLCEVLDAIYTSKNHLFEDGYSNYEVCPDIEKDEDGVLYNNRTHTLVYCMNKDLSDYRIKEGTCNIRRFAFSDCKKLHTIILPSTLEYFKKYTLSGCDSLKFIVAPIPNMTDNQCWGALLSGMFTDRIAYCLIPESTTGVTNGGYVQYLHLDEEKFAQGIICNKTYSPTYRELRDWINTLDENDLDRQVFITSRDDIFEKQSFLIKSATLRKYGLPEPPEQKGEEEFDLPELDIDFDFGIDLSFDSTPRYFEKNQPYIELEYRRR